MEGKDSVNDMLADISRDNVSCRFLKREIIFDSSVNNIIDGGRSPWKITHHGDSFACLDLVFRGLLELERNHIKPDSCRMIF